MKIIKLMAQNFKNLHAIEITPDGNVVEITGANGAGKTAILEAIFCTLTGTRVEDAIRHGQERAEVSIDMGDFFVKRVWTEKGERLEVVNKDGDVKKSPQTFLNGIIGKISFDPLEFANKKPKEQREILRELVGLDFKDIEDEYQKSFDARSVVNSNIKGVVAQLQEATEPDPNTPDEEISYKDELQKLNVLRDKKKAFDAYKESCKDVEESRLECNIAIENYLKAIEQLKEKIEDEKLKISGLNIIQESLICPPEVREEEIIAVESSLQEIEQKNVIIREAKRYRELVRQSNKLKKDSDNYTEKLNRLEQDKSTRIANTVMPIEGLSMTDDSLLFKGNIFNRISTGQQYQVATAIAMKLNPLVRVILIKEGSLLDKAGKQAIYDIAKEHDFLVVMETVDETGLVGVYIEDGTVIKVHGKDAPKVVVEPPPQKKVKGAVAESNPVEEMKLSGDEGMEV